MRTRATVTGLAVAIAVLLAGGIVAAIEGSGSNEGDGPGSRTAVLSADQVGRTTEVGANVDGKVQIPLPTTTTTVAAAPTTPPPPPPPSTTTSTRATTTTTRPRSTTTTTLSIVPPPPPSTIPPLGSLSNQSGNTTLDVEITPDEPRAGQTVTFVFEYSSDFPCCDLLVDFGDGTGFSDDAGVTCPEVPPRQPGSRKLQRTHTYAKAGTYTLSVSAVAHSRCELVIPDFHAARVSGALVVS